MKIVKIILSVAVMLLAADFAFAQTWMQATNAPSNGSVNCIASSADGTKLVAGISGWIYTSTNSGVTWISNNVPHIAWPAIASSADGNKLAAVAQGGGIYTTTNSGVLWTQTIAPTNNWLSIASSA